MGDVIKFSAVTAGRFIRVKLANPDHKMPMPGQARLFGAVETADTYDAFWLCLLADGSVIPVDDHEKSADETGADETNDDAGNAQSVDEEPGVEQPVAEAAPDPVTDALPLPGVAAAEDA